MEQDASLSNVEPGKRCWQMEHVWHVQHAQGPKMVGEHVNLMHATKDQYPGQMEPVNIARSIQGNLQPEEHVVQVSA